MCVWVMTVARLRLKVKVIGQGQGLGLGVSTDRRPSGRQLHASTARRAAWRGRG